MKLLEKIILMLIFLMFIPFAYAQICYDPDGLDYSQKNCVIFNGVTDKYCDSCIGSKLLIEWYCTGNKLNLTTYYCPDLCSNGECVSSIPFTSPITEIQESEGCNSCSDAYTIECNRIIRRTFTPYDDKDFFKFTLDRRMKVRIRLNSTSDTSKELFGDYDLYVKWDGSCPNIDNYWCGGYNKTGCCMTRNGIYDCGPCSESIDRSNNMNEYCPEVNERILEPGTYYFLVYNYLGKVPYDVTLICPETSQTVTTTTTQITTTTTPTPTTTTTTPECPYSCQCMYESKYGVSRCKCPSGYEEVTGYSCPIYESYYNPYSGEIEVLWQKCCKKITPDVSMQYPVKPYYQGDVLDINVTATDDKGISQIKLEIVSTDEKYSEYYDCLGKTPCSHIFSITLDQTDYWQFEVRVNDTDNHLTATFPNGDMLLFYFNVNPSTTSISTTSISTSTSTSTTSASTTSTIITATTITGPGCTENLDCCKMIKYRQVRCTDGKCYTCTEGEEGCVGCGRFEPLNLLNFLIQFLKSIFGWH